ncbi:MAG: mandelate racemase/muconate lactonizing enzyme family protein [Hyphomicrobiales bacterium]
MRIASVDHKLVKVPFTETILWGSGARTGTSRLVCRIKTEDGVFGWGETQCLIDTVPAAFSKVAQLAIGMPVSDVERLFRKVMGAGYYHHKRAAVMAIAALEMAMWDAFGKATGQPLWALWGGVWRDEVRAAAYTFTNDPALLGDRLKAFQDNGYRDFKVKIGFDAKSDIELAETAREVIGDAALRLDVNGAWTPGTAKRQLEKLRACDPAYVEQPLELDDLAGTARLCRSQPIPITLDESAYTLQDVGNIVQAGAADYLLLDPHQAGGLWQAIKAAAVCESHGIAVGLHSGAELALSQSAYIHLAASIPNMSLAIDTERRYLGGDISDEPPKLLNGAFPLLDGPGLGVSVDQTAINRFAVDAISGAYLDENRPDWFPTKPMY